MPCLDENQLVAFSKGLLSPESVGQVLDHVGNCQSCAALIAMLSEEQASGLVVPSNQIGSTSVKDIDASAGPIKNRYVLTKQIGMGGMGVVYGAYDVILERKVALKVLRAIPGNALDSAAGRSRLAKEARTLARLTHPNVVRVYDAGWMGGRFFIAMEMIEGLSLRAWLSEKTRHWKAIRDVFVQAGQGLVAIHAAGLVHRDFKPENVVVGNDGLVRVMDFGLVALVQTLDKTTAKEEGEGIGLSQQNLLAGTPAYMAPEQAAGKTVDARADQFSFCVALHEAFFGKRPALNDSNANPVTLPSKHNLPARITAILNKGLDSDPAKRFVSMRALLKELAEEPRARVRQWSLASAVLILLLVAVLGLQYLETRQQERCVQDTSEIADIWNEQKSKLIQKTFASTNASYAGNAWHTVDQILSKYVAKWQKQRGKLCERTASVFGSTLTTADAMRLYCLECRKSEVQALVSVFTKADVSVVEHAVQAVMSLAPVHQCVALNSPAMSHQWTSNPNTQKALEHLVQEKAAVLAMLHAGQGIDALPQAKVLVEHTKEVAYRPLLADAYFLLGRCFLAGGLYAKAEEAFFEAVDTSEQSGHEEMRFRSLLQLASIKGNVERRLDEAVLLARLAQAAKERMGPNLDASLQAELSDVMAQLWYYQGRPKTARGYAEDALTLLEASMGPDSPDVWWQKSLLAWISKDLGEFEQALGLVEQSLSARKRVLGELHPEVAKGLYNLAGVYLDQKESRLAISALLKAKQTSQNAMGPEHLLSLRYSASLAHALFLDGQTTQALDEIDQVLPKLEQVAGPENPRVAELMAIKGKVFLAQKRFRKAIEVLQKSLEIMGKNISKDHPWLAGLFIDSGKAYWHLGELNIAENVLKKAVKLLDFAEGGYMSEVSEARFLMARVIAAKTKEMCGEALENAKAAWCNLKPIADYRQEELLAMDAWFDQARSWGCVVDDVVLTCEH